MSEVPANLKYTKSHEWVELGADGVATIGITDHAQELLGDLVFVETPEVGDSTSAGDACAVVESVKAASDLYAPLSGEVTEVNEALGDSPELVNQSAYVDGWIFKVKISDEAELDELMDANAYNELLAEENE